MKRDLDLASSPGIADDDRLYAELYMACWSTPDEGRRRELVEVLYAPRALLLTSPPHGEPFGCEGRDELAELISHLHRTMTQKHQLISRVVGITLADSASRPSLTVKWEQVEPSGRVAVAGADTLHRSVDGYIFLDQLRLKPHDETTKTSF